jgi:transposase
VLKHLCRAGRTGAWVALRARAVLLAARGVGNRAIARAVDRTPRWVRLWRERFARDRLNGLVDTPRAGRPARFSPRRTS